MTASAPFGGRCSRKALTLALLLGGASASSERSCAAGAAEGSCAAGSTSGHALVQKRTIVRHGVASGLEGATYRGGDCAQRLGHGSSHPAACIVTKDNKAMLVNVYYGKSPGWDLPGGWHHGGEAPCETAEREVCEETGMSVRAVAKLSGNVFKCEITGAHVCTKPVDEGFLQYRFFSKQELGGLKFRGGSWGDKVGLLHQTLEPELPHGSLDACGCRHGVDGWSTTTQGCASSSQTSPLEAIECQRRSGSEDFDECGCRRGAQGWSSTSRRCSTTSDTSPSEADACSEMSVELATED